VARRRPLWRASEWRKLIPRNVAVLGEVTSCCLHDPSSGRFFGFDPVPGSVLVADASGRRMYILRPLHDAGAARFSTQSIRAAELHERFTHRESDGYYNAAIPPARKPTFAGELVIVRYLAQKDIDDEVSGEEVEWEHYFENPGQAPAYAELWSIGHRQFYIPPGPWRVDSAGIEYAHPSHVKEELYGS
jgi:hypothetical protein